MQSAKSFKKLRADGWASRKPRRVYEHVFAPLNHLRRRKAGAVSAALVGAQARGAVGLAAGVGKAQAAGVAAAINKAAAAGTRVATSRVRAVVNHKTVGKRVPKPVAQSNRAVMPRRNRPSRRNPKNNQLDALARRQLFRSKVKSPEEAAGAQGEVPQATPRRQV